MTINETLVSIAMLPQILKAAQLLADAEVLRQEDVMKCVRLYVKKHPEINEHIASQAFLR